MAPLAQRRVELVGVSTMKTYADGNRDPTHLVGFEIDSVLVSRRTIARLLRTVEGVTDVRVRGSWGSKDDVRVAFKYRDRDYIVYEPWGDNSRYWICPAFPEPAADEPLDIGPIKSVFDNHSVWPARVFWILIVLGLVTSSLLGG